MSSNVKSFVLDTNIILDNYINILSFGDKDVIIPIAVIEELDNKKKLQNDVGMNARKAIRLIDEVCGYGNIADGISLDSVQEGVTGSLRVVMDVVDSKLEKQIEKKLKRVDYDYADNRILLSALQCGDNVVFVTKDINLRIKANALGLEIQSVEEATDDVIVDRHDNEVTIHEVRNSVVSQVYSDKVLELPEAKGSGYNSFHLVCSSNKNRAPMRLKGQKLHLLSTLDKRPVQGISPRNLEQCMALDLILDPSVSLVTLQGQAGTGKTLLAIAAALHMLEKHMYNKIMIMRPVVAAANDIGFLPGTREEKLAPWLQPIFDNLEYIYSIKDPGANPKKKIGELQSCGKLELEALTYIRGRSLPKMLIIADEMQNASTKLAKTLLTRVGEDSKIILTGDVGQIDSPYLDSTNNALAYTANKFKGIPVAGHVSLHSTERSKLAEIAAKIM